jgi:hypothetical protein
MDCVRHLGQGGDSIDTPAKTIVPLDRPAGVQQAGLLSSAKTQKISISGSRLYDVLLQNDQKDFNVMAHRNSKLTIAARDRRRQHFLTVNLIRSSLLAREWLT